MIDHDRLYHSKVVKSLKDLPCETAKLDKVSSTRMDFEGIECDTLNYTVHVEGNLYIFDGDEFCQSQVDNLYYSLRGKVQGDEMP